ncbi:MAG TPA: hypothetical protein VGN12_19980 [Pirellulales bacterium]|jgi:hypothetical protein
MAILSTIAKMCETCRPEPSQISTDELDRQTSKKIEEMADV